VIVSEIVMTQGRPTVTWKDAGLFAIVAATGAAELSRLLIKRDSP
jgi:hypothetical protein